jgi:hypothetical protein
MCRRRINVSAYETLLSGSTTITGLLIQSRTLFGMLIPPFFLPSS